MGTSGGRSGKENNRRGLSSIRQKGNEVTTYRVNEEDLNTMCEKLVAAQTLLNVDAIAIMEGRKPLRASVRLDLAEEAEDLVGDVTNMLFGIKAQPGVG